MSFPFTQARRILWFVLAFALEGLIASHVQAHPGSGLAVNPKGEIFFTHGNAIIQIDEAGRSSVLARGEGTDQFYQLHHLVLDKKGSLYTASDSGTGIWKVTPEGAWKRHFPSDGQNPSLLIGLGGSPFTMDAQENVYSVNLVHNNTSQIMRITPSGRIRVLAGGDWGHRDGQPDQARFGDLHGGSMIMASDGSILLTDDGRFLRRISPDGSVTTLAGTQETTHPSAPPKPIEFQALRGLALDNEGAVYVADAGGTSRHGGRIYKIEVDGQVGLLAGCGQPVLMEGPALQVGFLEPTGLALGPNGDLFILEPLFPRVRKLTSEGEVKWVLQRLH